MGLALSVDIRCNGMYSYTIADPLLFYTNVASNVAEEYTRDMIDETLKSEMLNALQPALATLAAARIQYYELSGKTMEIRDALNEALSREWGELRGLKVVSIAINSLTLPDEDMEMIKQIFFFISITDDECSILAGGFQDALIFSAYVV